MSNSTSVQVVLVNGRYHRDTCKRVQAEAYSPTIITGHVVSGRTPAATCCKPNNSPQWKAVAADLAAAVESEAAEVEAEVAEAKAAHPSSGKGTGRTIKNAPAEKDAPTGPKRRLGSPDAPGTDVAYRGTGWVRYWPTIGNLAGQVLVATDPSVEVTYVDNVNLGLRLKGKKAAVKAASERLLDMWGTARPAVRAWATGEGAELYADKDGKEMFLLDKDFLAGFGEGYVRAVVNGEEAADAPRATEAYLAGFAAGSAAALAREVL